MEVINFTKKQDGKRPLKRAKTGFETEFHLIDEEGRIQFRSLELIEKIKKEHPEISVTKECGKNMIELGCFPDINTYNPALEIIESIEKVIKLAKKEGLRLYPFSTYPGKFKPQITEDETGKYEIRRKIFGEEKFAFSTKVVGFHHHYTLPKSVFDEEKKELRLLIDSKLKRSLMNSYNFEIAIDPILSLLTQSSPFFEGKNLAKDSRNLIYRGGKKLGYPGVHSNLQLLGGLPPYKQTETDLLNSLKLRKQKWRRLVKKADPKADFKKMYPYDLDISWNPVKINKHGTLEQRGMGMNYMSIIVAVSTLIKFCLKKIQRDFIEVIPADLGMTDSFKLNKNNIMYIPPHTYVRGVLQKASVYQGFESEELYEYTKRFVKLAKKLTPKFYRPLIKHVEKMVKDRKSTSDRILVYSKRFMKNGEISDKNARRIAIHFTNKFEKDLKKTKDLILKIIEKHKSLSETGE